MIRIRKEEAEWSKGLQTGLKGLVQDQNRSYNRVKGGRKWKYTLKKDRSQTQAKKSGIYLLTYMRIM